MLSIGALFARDDVDARLGMGASPLQGILANPQVRQYFCQSSKSINTTSIFCFKTQWDIVMTRSIPRIETCSFVIINTVVPVLVAVSLRRTRLVSTPTHPTLCWDTSPLCALISYDRFSFYLSHDPLACANRLSTHYRNSQARIIHMIYLVIRLQTRLVVYTV